MLARTAFGECGSAQCGPSATHEAPNASAERRIVPTLPGSPDAVQVHAQRADRLTPALLVHADRARARAERGHRAQSRRLDVVELRAADLRAGQAVALDQRAPGTRGREHQVLALGGKASAARTLASRRQALDAFEPGVLI